MAHLAPQPTFRQELPLEVLCRNFRLDEWLKKPRERAFSYFKAIEGLRDVFRTTTAAEPQDGDLVLALAATLAADSTFRGYLLTREGSSELTSDELLEKVRIAGAGMIMMRYYDARARGDWPQQGSVE